MRDAGLGGCRSSVGAADTWHAVKRGPCRVCCRAVPTPRLSSRTPQHHNNPPPPPPPLRVAEDPVKRAHVDSVVFWQGSTLREGLTGVIVHRVMAYIRKFSPCETVASEYGLPRLKSALSTIENVFLAGGARWVAGGDDISIADLQLLGDVENLVMLDAAKEVRRRVGGGGGW